MNKRERQAARTIYGMTMLIDAIRDPHTVDRINDTFAGFNTMIATIKGPDVPVDVKAQEG